MSTSGLPSFSKGPLKEVAASCHPKPLSVVVGLRGTFLRESRTWPSSPWAALECPPRAPLTKTPWPSVLSSSPFDTEIFLVSPSPTVKLSVGSRKGSLYNWTPPSTPSFRERYYLVSGPGTLWSRWDWRVRWRLGTSVWDEAEQPGASRCRKLWVQPPSFSVILGVFL